MTEQGPSLLHRVFPGYIYFTAIWEWEIICFQERLSQQSSKRSTTSWSNIIVLDSSQPVHLEPLSKSEMDKLFDGLSSAKDD